MLNRKNLEKAYLINFIEAIMFYLAIVFLSFYLSVSNFT